MKVPEYYQIFFELRDKYKHFPTRCALLADLMSIPFQHNDTFPDEYYLYLKDCYPEEDIQLILEELHLPFHQALSSSARPKLTSIIQLKTHI